MLGDSVLAAGGAASQSCLGRTEKHTLAALLAGGIAHPPLSSRGFCSTPQSRFSWVRSARRDEEQVFLLCCQGDADWFPGQVSQYIYIYIYISINQSINQNNIKDTLGPIKDTTTTYKYTHKDRIHNITITCVLKLQ